MGTWVHMLYTPLDCKGLYSNPAADAGLRKEGICYVFSVDIRVRGQSSRLMMGLVPVYCVSRVGSVDHGTTEIFRTIEMKTTDEANRPTH